MKFKTSIAFEDMNGSAKGVTASRNASGSYLQSKSLGGRRSATGKQSQVRAIFKQLQKSWKDLTESQRKMWQAAAQSTEGRRVLGQSVKLTGVNLYLRLNFWVVRLGGTALEIPARLNGVECPADAQLFVGEDGISLELRGIPQERGLKLIVMALEPQSMGAVKPAGKGSMIGQALEADNQVFDIGADYVTKFGTVSAGRPRVIIRYFLVNALTGEKSMEKVICGFYSAGPATKYVLSTAVDDDENGSVTPAGEHEYRAGAIVRIEATANDGFAFDSWDDGNTENPRNITMNGDISLTARFVNDLHHTIRVVASPTGGGLVSGGGSYLHGETATLQAVAQSGYEFVGWADDPDAGATRTVEVEASMSFTAQFRVVVNNHRLTLHTNLSEAGEVTPVNDDYRDCYDGEEVEIQAYPSSDYHFVKWSDGNTHNPRTIIMDRDIELTAEMESEFEADVAAECYPEIGGRIDGADTYPVGRKVTVTAVPADGYEFGHWGDESAEGATREFYLGEDGVLLEAYFREVE